MTPLPMVPSSCSLSEAELHEQLARYRRVGEGAVVTHAPRRIVVQTPADDRLISELIETERSCCPFFQFTRDGGRLEIAVSDATNEPALALLAEALTSGRVRAGG